jgi:predicted nucleic acid-binding protein
MILVDTGPLVALCDARDALHRKAVEHLAGMPALLCVCDAVLTEACFHLPNKSQRERLHAVLEELRFECVPTHDAGFRAAVFAWLSKYSEHEPDWADGCIAVLCSRHRRVKVWTYDSEFRTTWRRPDGKTIGLAVRL